MTSKKKATKKPESMFSDPVPPDENDPDFIEAMCYEFKLSGDKPEDLKDKKWAKTYADWLKKPENQ